MGFRFVDQYSLLHFAIGIVLYFWNISFTNAIVMHTIFETFENSKHGMAYINKHIIHPGYFSWPGGKHASDSFTNILGDTIFFAIGWILSAYLDIIGKQRGWYRYIH